MKIRLLLGIATCFLFGLGACSSDNDEPKLPNEASKYVSQADFNQLVKGKVWKVYDVKTMMSDGRIFDETIYRDMCGETFVGSSNGLYVEPNQDRVIEFWTCSHYSMYHERFIRRSYSYTYDENTGGFAFGVENFKLISVTEDELIAHMDFGRVRKDFPSESFTTDEYDEGSCTIVYLRPVTEEEASKLWEEHVDVDGIEPFELD